MPGVFQRFGSNPGGAGPIYPIAPTQIAAGNQARISDWGATLGSAGADTLLSLQISNDGIAWVEVSRIELPAPGTMQKEFKYPIRVTAGQWIQVEAFQGTPDDVSTELLGDTTGGDVADI